MSQFHYSEIEQQLVEVLPEIRPAAEFYWQTEGTPGQDDGPYIFWKAVLATAAGLVGFFAWANRQTAKAHARFTDKDVEAAEARRGLIDAIVLTPEPPSRAVDGARYGAQAGELRIELKGNLAAMLGAAQNGKRSPETGDLTLQVVMVAGARNPLNLEFSWSAA